MRPGQIKRPRGRNPSNNQNNNRRGNGGGGGGNQLNRTYESNGPDVKVRGTAHQIAEKYIQLWRDAQSGGDTVAAEGYLQHAEHYYRIVAVAQAAFPSAPSIMRADDERLDGLDENGEGEESALNQQQPQEFSENEGGNGRDNRYMPRNNRFRRDQRDDYRQPRENREYREREPRQDYRQQREERPPREAIAPEGDAPAPRHERQPRPPRGDYSNDDARSERDARPAHSDRDVRPDRPERDARPDRDGGGDRYAPRENRGRGRPPRQRYNPEDQPDIGGLPSFITGAAAPVSNPPPVTPGSVPPAPLRAAADEAPASKETAPAPVANEADDALPARPRRGRPPKAAVTEATGADDKPAPRRRAAARKPEDVSAE